MGYNTIGITYAGDMKGWPKNSRADAVVTEFAAHERDEGHRDFQWAEIRPLSLTHAGHSFFRGGVHGGTQSSESHDHVTVRYTDITGDKYDAHVAVKEHTEIDHEKSKIWKR